MNMYLINALLVLLVIRQIREHQLDVRALAVPVLAVAAAAVMFLHAVPGGGSDIALDLACVSAGAAMGAIGGLATRLRLGAEGRPLGRAGTLAAGMWIAGVGARMVFYFAATHGAGPAIAAFSIAHHITGSAAWTAALVMMALADVLTGWPWSGSAAGGSPPPASRPSRHLSRLAPVPEPASGPHSPAPSPIGRRRPRRLIPATPRPVSVRYRADVIGPPACRQPTPGLVPASTGTCTGGRICRS
jgi:hypothetical protein